MRLISWHQCCTMQWAERLDIHTLKILSSGPREALYWPKNGLRSKISSSPNFGGSMLPDSLNYNVLMDPLQTWSLQPQTWWLQPCICPIWFSMENNNVLYSDFQSVSSQVIVYQHEVENGSCIKITQVINVSSGRQFCVYFFCMNRSF